MIMWAIQIFLALAFGAAGTMKLVSREICEHAQVGFDPTLDIVLLNLDDDVLAAV